MHARGPSNHGGSTRVTVTESTGPGPRFTVSTVIPTYNRAALLARAIRSAVAECEPGDEVIVVDDGSTDDTEAIVREWGPPVRYLRAAHGGAGAARNAGVRAATGDLVAFLDSDDVWVSGKLSWQRAVMEHRPDILYLFSDFGSIMPSGERQHHRLSSSCDESRVRGALSGAAWPSDRIPELPSPAPHFGLRVGRLYETYIRDWCVFTCTVIVRREHAGEALHFPEDVPTYEDVECFARLARRGLAGYMDCETAWQDKHSGPRLTDADATTNADTAMRIINRVWGADADYLRHHRDEFEVVLDAHRTRRVRSLLRRGCTKEARRELPEFFRIPWALAALCYAPGSLLRFAAETRDSWRRAST